MISKGAQYIFCVVLGICAVDLKIGAIFDMVCVFLYLVAMLFGEKLAFPELNCFWLMIVATISD